MLAYRIVTVVPFAWPLAATMGPSMRCGHVKGASVDGTHMRNVGGAMVESDYRSARETALELERLERRVQVAEATVRHLRATFSEEKTRLDLQLRELVKENRKLRASLRWSWRWGWALRFLGFARGKSP